MRHEALERREAADTEHDEIAALAQLIGRCGSRLARDLSSSSACPASASGFEAGPAVRCDQISHQGLAQPRARVTASRQRAILACLSAAAIRGSKRFSACQCAASSSRDRQKIHGKSRKVRGAERRGLGTRGRTTGTPSRSPGTA